MGNTSTKTIRQRAVLLRHSRASVLGKLEEGYRVMIRDSASVIDLIPEPERRSYWRQRFIRELDTDPVRAVRLVVSVLEEAGFAVQLDGALRGIKFGAS